MKEEFDIFCMAIFILVSVILIMIGFAYAPLYVIASIVTGLYLRGAWLILAESWEENQ